MISLLQLLGLLLFCGILLFCFAKSAKGTFQPRSYSAWENYDKTNINGKNNITSLR